MSFWDFLKRKDKKKQEEWKEAEVTTEFENPFSVQRDDNAANFYWWKKGQVVGFSQNFSSYEFDCPCDSTSCKEQRLHVELVQKLQYLRDKLGYPLRINSGYRCIKYQEKLRKKGYKTAKKTSQHSLGKAVDAGLTGSKNIEKRMKKFLAESEKLFKAIGIGSRFLHLDLRLGKKRRWYY